MDNVKLNSILSTAKKETVKYSDKSFYKKNLELQKAYLKERNGSEVDGRSQVQSSDVFDTTEADMAALTRVFLGSNDILKFEPLLPQDTDEAEQKTKYANYLIRNQKNSFKTIFDWMKEADYQLASVIHYNYEEKESVQYETYSGLSEDEQAVMLDDIKTRYPDSEINIEPDKDGNISFKVRRKIKDYLITNIPIDSFLITKGAKSKEEAALIGHEELKTKGELVAAGYSKSKVKNLTKYSQTEGDEAKKLRQKDQGRSTNEATQDWTMEKVLVEMLYVLVDYDNDGIAERRLIIRVGKDILLNRPFGHEPYAILCSILMPHTLIGRTRGEEAKKIQDQKTALKRAMMDNIYQVGRPRMGVNDAKGSINGRKVNLDDLLSQKIGGVVRTDGHPAENLFPIETPYVGDKILQVSQQLDSERSNSLGTLIGNQALDYDNLHKETATRFEGINDAQKAKIELLARVYSETGFRQLYEGIIWLAQHYQRDDIEIMVLNEPLAFNPKDWRNEHICKSQVGLAAGDSDEMISNIGALLTLNSELISRGSLLADDKKVYNLVSDLVKAMGKSDVSRYFNDPEKPEDILQAENQQLNQAVQLLQRQVQQNPLAEAEAIKAQSKADAENKKLLIESQKMRNDMIKWAKEYEQADEERRQDLIIKLTEMELRYGQDIPNSLV